MPSQQFTTLKSIRQLPSVYSPIYLSIQLFNYQSIYPTIYLSQYLSIFNAFIYLSIRKSNYL